MAFENKLNKRLDNVPGTLWMKIAQIDELKGQWIAGCRFDTKVLNRLQQDILVRSTASVVRLCRIPLTNQDVEKIIYGVALPTFTHKQKATTLGYYELLSHIFNSWKTITLSEPTLQHFHAQLLKYEDGNEHMTGNFRTDKVATKLIKSVTQKRLEDFPSTPANLIPNQIQKLIDWTNQALEKKLFHPLLITPNFILEFLSVHPFPKGSSRLSFILTNLLLLKSGYPYIAYTSYENLLEKAKSNYYISLQQSLSSIEIKQENRPSWLEFFLDTFLKQSEQAIDLFPQTPIENLLSDNQLTVWHYLQKNYEVTTGEIVKETNIARPTVNQILDKLLRLKKIERIGVTRSARYRKI